VNVDLDGKCLGGFLTSAGAYIAKKADQVKVYVNQVVKPALNTAGNNIEQAWNTATNEMNRLLFTAEYYINQGLRTVEMYAPHFLNTAARRYMNSYISKPLNYGFAYVLFDLLGRIDDIISGDYRFRHTTGALLTGIMQYFSEWTGEGMAYAFGNLMKEMEDFLRDNWDDIRGNWDDIIDAINNMEWYSENWRLGCTTGRIGGW